MSDLEQKIKDFVKGLGVDVVGVAGPERLSGPPSMDPTYTMSGAKSIVSMALPFNVPAIYEFLGKKSPAPHNMDQLLTNQRMHREGKKLEEFIKSLGHRAKVVPPNNTYRRSLDVFSTHPSFSHRFGAIAAGIAAQGWSGNVMTKQHGAAVVLGTVVTDAKLQSDPALPPRFFIDEFCYRCKLCDKVCPAGMFEQDGEEHVLINNELHPRGKRRCIDLCNISCFGLHGLSRDKKWSSWGRHWINDWVEHEPDYTNKRKIRRALLIKGSRTGDSTLRYDLIRRLGSMLWPEELITQMPELQNPPEDEVERNKALGKYAEKIGVTGLKDFNVLTCGQCALVCGPDLKETADRYHTLVESGIVVPGPEGRMTHASNFEEALEIRKKYPQRISKQEMNRDARASAALWHKFYFGVEPKSIIQDLSYKRRLKKALKKNGADKQEKNNGR